MPTHYTFTPGIAALLYVQQEQGNRISVVFLSHEKGAVLGANDMPIADYGWPPPVIAEINKHFGTVFSLAHEDWKGPGPSPRAKYCDALVPWSILVDEQGARI